jgi:hypothetical protein
MGTAYTPGLKVSARTTVEKLRRLPLKGTVLVEEGQIVSPETVLARTELPGIMQTIKVAERLGIEAGDVAEALRTKVGDSLEVGDLIAETKGLFGRFFRGELRSPYRGKVELISPVTGHVGVREAPLPVEREAYIRGTVTQVIPEEGAVVACEGAQIQGIFGVGGERRGEIVVVTDGPSDSLTETAITEAHRGRVIVGGASVTGGALRRAVEVGAIGIVCGGVVDRELIDFLAEQLGQPDFDIGVAITGQEPIPFSLILTEGFGSIAMAARTFELLKTLEGRSASINGATQIRAGVIRPEVIVPLSDAPAKTQEKSAMESGRLDIGTPIRIIREPYFGALASVSALPPELVKVESETHVRVLEARLPDGRTVTVPRANVEIIETS